MPYEYGSEQIDIPNPFRFEGAMYTLRAVVFLALGIYTLLQVKAIVAAGPKALGVGEMLGGISLLGLGVFGLYLGLFKMFRFYVGRGQPADLAATVSSEQSVMPGVATGGSTHFSGIYDPKMLDEMLLGRKNPTFTEPEGWLPRMLHSVDRRLIFLPYALRNDATSHFVATAYTIVMLALLGLAWFSGVSGLLPVTGTEVMPWLVLIVTAIVLVIWLREAMSSSRYSRASLRKFGPLGLVLWIVVAMFAPVALVLLNNQHPLPAPPISPALWFLAILVVAAVACSFSIMLALRRAPRNSPPTQVAEYREHWQESVHPMDIFRAVEITLAKHRYKEIPNRLYENDVPELQGQGANIQGEFKGSTLQEIQPQPVADRRNDIVIKLGIIVGQLLLLAAGLCLFVALLGLRDFSSVRLTETLLGAVVLWIAGQLIAHTANLYVSEIEFESDLIAFNLTGTYSESRVATGMSIYDSTRSENTVVRSSLTPWLLVSRLRSSTLTVSGANNLEQVRLVLGMQANKELNEELVADVRAFLNDRQIMASVSSSADLEAAGNIYRMNEQTRPDLSKAGPPLISQERRDDKPMALPGDNTGDGNV